MDIPATVQEFKAALESSGISQRFAAKFIMDSTSQGNLSFLLEKGKSKHWSELSCRGRLPYIRMRRWLDSPEEQRITLSQLSMTKGTTAIFNFCAYLSHLFFHFIFTLIVFFHFFLKYLLDLFVLVEYNFYVPYICTSQVIFIFLFQYLSVFLFMSISSNFHTSYVNFLFFLCLSIQY